MKLQLRPAAPSRPDIARAFAHLAQGSRQEGAGDPITAMRRFVDRYGDVGPRPSTPDCEVRPVKAGDAPCEWILPQSRVGDDRIVLLHGGGWVAGGLESHRPMAAALAELTGWPVLLVDYRLAPEHPFPAAFDDCRAALSFAAENGPHGPGAAPGLHLVGDSAGGNLAAAVCLASIGSRGPAPSRLVMMSPPLDGAANPGRGELAASNGDQAALEAMMSLYLESPDQVRDPRVSPLLADSEVLARFPPTLIQASHAEFLVWDAGAFAERLMANGVRVSLSLWPGLPHVWQAFLGLLPEAREALLEAAVFLTGRGPAAAP